MLGDIFKEIGEWLKTIFRVGGEFILGALKTPEGAVVMLLLLMAISSALAPLFMVNSEWYLPAWLLAHGFGTPDGQLTAASMMYGIAMSFLRLWWLWIIFILYPIFWDLLLHYKGEVTRATAKWALLELMIPRVVMETPQAMESVFLSMHNLGGGPDNFKEKYIDGDITKWFNFEIVSLGGMVHFFVRCPKGVKNEVEAAFFAYYPDIDVVEAKEDYMDKIPPTMADMYAQNREVWASEIILAKDEMYPLKTYPLFTADDPEKQIDPVSSLIEILGKIGPDEIAAVHLLCRPGDKKWNEAWKEKVTELRTGGKKPEGDEKQTMRFLSPGETLVLKQVEMHLSKPVFDTVIRMFHTGPASVSPHNYRRAITGYFNQYGTLDMNSFRPNGGMSTRVVPHESPYMFTKLRVEYRKQRVLDVFRRRRIPVETYWGKWFETYLFNSGFHPAFSKLTPEELATLWHPPTEFILTAPHIQRSESKKAGPPAGLAIFGEEAEIEDFYKK